MIKVRVEPEANYKAVFCDGQTIRMPINPRKEVTELKFPEFYDLSFGNKCETGKCSFCYASASPRGIHYSNIVDKVMGFFGKMDQNQRPFQVAIGGEQEPLEHPEFWNAVKALRSLGIVPNYTTNGVLITEDIIAPTKEFCGGVAVTLHPHLEKHWRKALDIFIGNGIKINTHIIISDNESVDFTRRAFDEYNGKVDYFVLLPYMSVGHAAKSPKSIDLDALEKWLDSVEKFGNIAFGANFYDFLCAKRKWDVSLYPPEIMSKYLIMNDLMLVCNNSFDKKQVKSPLDFI
jgi:hypothetical protein